MKNKTPVILNYQLLFIVLVLIAGKVWAIDDVTHKTVGGMDVYIGMVPAEIIQGRNLPKEIIMHDGGALRGNMYHLVVALFDIKNRERITKAKVTANISVPGSAGSTKKLERMEVNNMVTFGNYFAFPKTEPYYIRLNLDIPGKRETGVVFEFRSPVR